MSEFSREQRRKLRLLIGEWKKELGGTLQPVADALGVKAPYVHGLLNEELDKQMGLKPFLGLLKHKPAEVAKIVGVDLARITPGSEQWQRELARLPTTLRHATCAVVYIEMVPVSELLPIVAALQKVHAVDEDEIGVWVERIRSALARSRVQTRE